MDTKHFKSKIAPFFWVNYEDQFSVCLSTGEYKQELFETREEEGMYCAYATDADALRDFILKFREICDNDSLIKDLFLRVEIE